MTFDKESKPVNRCPICNKRLFDGWALYVAIKCPGCNKIVTIENIEFADLLKGASVKAGENQR